MNDMYWTGGDRHALETLVAELTDAAYAVALRHKKPGSWIDLELDLWRALGETVQKRVTQSDAPREPLYIDVSSGSQRRDPRLPLLSR
jgi:hypothetical protein